MVGQLISTGALGKGQRDCLGSLTGAASWPFLSRVAHLAVSSWFALRYDSHRAMRLWIGIHFG